MMRSPILLNRVVGLSAIVCLGPLAPQMSAVAAEAIDYERDIRPILEDRCGECHGPDVQESGLRVDHRPTLLRGGDYGLPAIVPHEPEESYLIRVVRGDDADLRMPPDGDPLSAEQVALLSRWIATGAEWPGQMDAAAEAPASDHWSLQPIARPRVPSLDLHQGSNPIDAFVLQKLLENGLKPSPPAGRAVLIRRVTLDLTGVPPTPEELAAFVSDPSDTDAAYERLVSRLLDSPRYGERWAQHWLDVIRWAETVGFETNAERPNAWPYRDWVIASLNEDKPYDEFLFEQIAGDTVGEDAALGFLVAGPANLPGQIGRDEEAMRQARQDELDEVIRTVGQGLFGLTIDCARCHNHKFDPITQRDYYAMQAIFSGLSYGERRLRGENNDAWTARVPEAEERLASLQRELEAVRQQHALRPPLKDVETETFEPVVARGVRMRIAANVKPGRASLYEFEVWSTATKDAPAENVALASGGAIPSASSFALENQTRHFDNLVDGTVDKRQAFPWVSAVDGEAWIQVKLPEPASVDRIVWHSGYGTPADYVIEVLPSDSDDWQRVADTRDRLPRIDDERPREQVQLASLAPEETAQVLEKVAAVRNAQKELARLAAGPQVYAASFSSEPEPTWLLRRGDPMQRAAVVVPAVPSVLARSQSAGSDTGTGGPSVEMPEFERRLALARHLTAPDHPLSSRVAVNRIWQHHFGVGLVETPSDFGIMGAPPSHPELLDWLAVEFVEHGWSTKHLHRLIVTSQTFRQASGPRDDALRIDADCRLLWRFPPRRLEAEAIRDSILAASGKLNSKMGGPGFDFFNQRGGLSDYIAKEEFDEEGWRRMIYAHKVRMQAIDIFGAFDCPDAGQMKPVRTSSITPVQSLSLLNSPFVNRQAAFFADRLHREVPEDSTAQINHAFRIVFSRDPNELEHERLAELAANHGLAQVCRVLFNASEFLVIQ